jgi:hypothetical protein
MGLKNGGAFYEALARKAPECFVMRLPGQPLKSGQIEEAPPPGHEKSIDVILFDLTQLMQKAVRGMDSQFATLYDDWAVKTGTFIERVTRDNLRRNPAAVVFGVDCGSQVPVLKKFEQSGRAYEHFTTEEMVGHGLAQVDEEGNVELSEALKLNGVAAPNEEALEAPLDKAAMRSFTNKILGTTEVRRTIEDGLRDAVRIHACRVGAMGLGLKQAHDYWSDLSQKAGPDYHAPTLVVGIALRIGGPSIWIDSHNRSDIETDGHPYHFNVVKYDRDVTMDEDEYTLSKIPRFCGEIDIEIANFIHPDICSSLCVVSDDGDMLLVMLMQLHAWRLRFGKERELPTLMLDRTCNSMVAQSDKSPHYVYVTALYNKLVEEGIDVPSLIYLESLRGTDYVQPIQALQNNPMGFQIDAGNETAEPEPTDDAMEVDSQKPDSSAAPKRARMTNFRCFSEADLMKEFTAKTSSARGVKVYPSVKLDVTRCVKLKFDAEEDGKVVDIQVNKNHVASWLMGILTDKIRTKLAALSKDQGISAASKAAILKYNDKIKGSVQGDIPQNGDSLKVHKAMRDTYLAARNFLLELHTESHLPPKVLFEFKNLPTPEAILANLHRAHWFMHYLLNENYERPLDPTAGRRSRVSFLDWQNSSRVGWQVVKPSDPPEVLDAPSSQDVALGKSYNLFLAPVVPDAVNTGIQFRL